MPSPIVSSINEHYLVKNAKRKFVTFFEELQRMRESNESPEFKEFIFLLETQLVTLYYQRIKQNLAIIASSEPDLLHFANEKELSDLAAKRLMQVLATYKHHDIALLLKCTSLSIYGVTS